MEIKPDSEGISKVFEEASAIDAQIVHHWTISKELEAQWLKRKEFINNWISTIQEKAKIDNIDSISDHYLLELASTGNNPILKELVARFNVLKSKYDKQNSKIDVLEKLQTQVADIHKWVIEQDKPPVFDNPSANERRIKSTMAPF